MRLPRLKIGDIIEIQWQDSAGTPGWMNETEIREQGAPASVRSIGYYMGKRHGSAIIAGDRQLDDGYVSRINRGESIPLGCIISVRCLK